MKFKNITLVKWLFTLSLLAISYTSFNSSSSPPTGNSGAPSEGNCTGCHNGSAVTSGTNWDAINISGLPASGYTPGTTYTFTVNGSSAATAKNGLLLTALNSSNTNAGTFTSGSGNAVLVSTRNYIGHTSAGTANSSFTFSWTAPATGVGTVTFYLSWLATNSNGGNTGDITYIKSFTLNQLANIPTAVINASSTSVCVGDTIILQGSGNNNPTSFAWTLTGGNPASASTQNTKVWFSTPGPKQIRLVTSNANGSSNPATVQVTINAKPVFSVTQSSVNLCGNADTVTIAATVVNGYSYLWMPGAIPTSSAKITNPGSYTVKVTTNNNCSATSNAYTVLRRNLPASGLVSDKDSSCVTDSIVMKATGFYNSYLFKKDNVLLKSGQDSFFKTASSGTYKLQVYDGFCYSTEYAKTVSVQNLLMAPNLFTYSNSVNQINFNWNHIQDASGYEVSLDSGKNWTAQIDTFINLNVLPQPQSKRIWVRAVSKSLCPYGTIASIVGSNANCIKPNLNFVLATKHCLQADSGFVAFNLINQSQQSFYAYSISIANLSYTKNQGDEAQIPIRLGMNSVHLICTDTTFTHCTIDTILYVQASIFSKFKPTFNLGQSVKNSCANASNFELKTSRLIGADSVFFMFFDSSLNRPIVLNPSGQDTVFNLTPFNQSTQVNQLYVLQKNIEYGCEAVSEIGLHRFLPDIGLEIAATTAPNSKLILFQSNSTYPFQKIYWDFGDSLSDSLNLNPSHTYQNSGNYLVQAMVLDSMNCSDTSSVSVFISATSMHEIEGVSGFKLFPNPAQESVTISANSQFAQVLNVVIYELNGKTVRSQFPLQFVQGMNAFTLQIAELKSGLYLLAIETKNGSIKQILTKE